MEKEKVMTFLEEFGYTNYQVDEPLKHHTTLKVGGNAAFVLTPTSTTEIVNVIKFLFKENIPYKIIGKGSNILFSDEDFPGMVIKNTKALSYLKVEEESIVVGSSYPLVKLAYDLAKEGLTGLEFVGGIPGTIGGAVHMNAGAYNKEMKDVIEYVTFIDVNGQLITLTNEELEFGYRHSIFKKMDDRVLILEAKLNLEKGNQEEIMALLKKRKTRRLDTQPLRYASCGSVFKNPENTNAYKLIDAVGLRGHRIGGAKFSDKHCNFIINDEEAKANDIKELIELAKNKVYHEFNVILVPEVEFFNW